MTRFAMRPAKSFWKNGQLWRTTCQWLCQRMRLVAPGIKRVVTDRDVREDRERPHDEHERHHCEQQRQRRRQRRLPVRRLHQRHEPADEQRNDGIEQRNGEACGEHGRVPALRLPNEVPVERDQSFGRSAGWRTRGCGNVEVDDLHGSVPGQLAPPLPQSEKGSPTISRLQHDSRFTKGARRRPLGRASSCRRRATPSRAAEP